MPIARNGGVLVDTPHSVIKVNMEYVIDITVPDPAPQRTDSFAIPANIVIHAVEGNISTRGAADWQGLLLMFATAADYQYHWIVKHTGASSNVFEVERRVLFRPITALIDFLIDCDGTVQQCTFEMRLNLHYRSF